MNRFVTVARRVAFGIVVFSALLYAGDYLSVRHRMAQGKPRDPLETMKIQPTYVIPHKDGRAEIIFGDPETQVCVHSLFPHLGYTPCWYVKRQSQKPIVMSMLPRTLLPVARAFWTGPAGREKRATRVNEIHHAPACSYGADFGFWGAFAMRSFCVGISEASQPPPSASIN